MNRKHRKNQKPRKDSDEIDFQTQSCKSNGMMWAFICEALVTKKYGASLHNVGRVDRKHIFAVKAINQKVFRSQETLQKDQSWALFLDYGDLKGRKKPVSSEDYTKLRSNFFNAIVKCTCDGVVERLDRQTASLLGVLSFKNYKYFSYEGTQAPTLENFKLSQTISRPKPKRRRLHVNAVELFKLDRPMEPGEYLFTAKVGADGLVEKTKLLGPYGGQAQIRKLESDSNSLERREDFESKISHLSDYSSDDCEVTEVNNVNSESEVIHVPMIIKKTDTKQDLQHTPERHEDLNETNVLQGEESNSPVIKIELDEEIYESTSSAYSRTSNATEEEIDRSLHVYPIVDVNIGGHCKFPNFIIKQEEDEAELIIS